MTIRGNDFRNKSHQRKLPEPTDVTAEVFALSKTLFSELWDGYTPLRLLGVTLGDVSDNETVQLSMFQDDQKIALGNLTRLSTNCAASSA